MSNIIAQYIAVALAVTIAVVWVVRRVIRRNRCGKGGCGCTTSESSPCDGCDLAGHYKSRRH